MADIRVDRYEFNCAGATGTLSITDVGDVNKAFIRNINSTLKSSGGQVGNTGTLGPDDIGCGLELTDTDEITYTKGTANTVKIMFEIWVYVGPDGGEYEFIIRDRESLQLSNGQSSATRTLTLPDRNRCIPILTSFKSEQGSNANFEIATLAVHIDTSNNVVVSRNNTGAGSTVTAFFTVVDFIGSGLNVGHGISTAHDAVGLAGYSVSLNTDSTGSGGSTFDVGDWSTAMILDASMEGDTSETGLADCYIVYEPNTTTSVTASMGDNNARNDGVSYVHVLQADNLIVDRYSNDNIPEGNNTYGTNLTVSGVNASTPLDQLSLEWYVSTTGTGTAWARGVVAAQLTSYNTIQHWVHRSGNNVKVRAGVVDMSALISTSSGGQIKTYTGTQFEAKPIKVWDGTSWEIKPLKYWDGTSWVETPY